MPRTLQIVETSRHKICSKKRPSMFYDSKESCRRKCPEDEKWFNKYIDPCTGDLVKEEYTKTYEICCGQKYEVEKSVVTREPPKRPLFPPPRKPCRPPPKCCKPCCRPSIPPCPPPCRKPCCSPPPCAVYPSDIRQVQNKLGKLDCQFRSVEQALNDAIIALGQLRC